MNTTPRILTLDGIRKALETVDPVAAMERAFVAYSLGLAVVPPVGELTFEEPPGDVHIKYGYVRGGEFYVVKIASGFYNNPQLRLASSNGLMLLFRQRTGELAAVLLDDGHLTDVRTAAAGAVCAKHLAPNRIERIGIVGTGIQARLQLEYLKRVTECRAAMVWGRTPANAESFAWDAGRLGFNVAVAPSAAALCEACRLIVTTTPTKSPLVYAEFLRPGTHITAVGSDTPDKQELDAATLARADVIVADSIAQCRERGEIAQALRAGAIEAARVVEVGAVIDGTARGRTRDEEITVADLTGVAVQDMMIAEAVLAANAGAPS